MTGLGFLRKSVLEIITGDKNVFPEYFPLPSDRRPGIYAAASVEEISFNRLMIYEGIKTYDTEIKVKVSVFAKPEGNPELLYEMTDSKIIDSYAKSGYSLKSVKVGKVYQNSKLGKMVLDTEIVLGARTAAV
jgi:hypothetical protein